MRLSVNFDSLVSREKFQRLTHLRWENPFSLHFNQKRKYPQKLIKNGPHLGHLFIDRRDLCLEMNEQIRLLYVYFASTIVIKTNDVHFILELKKSEIKAKQKTWMNEMNCVHQKKFWFKKVKMRGTWRGGQH